MGDKATIRPVVLQRHQAGRTVTPRDLDTIQENVQRALQNLQATKIISGQLATGAVGSQHLTANAIAQSAQLADGVIFNQHINTNANLDGQKLASGSVLSPQIGNNTIVEGNIAAGTITNASINAAANIDGAKLLANSVTDTQVASGISAAKISGALVASSIAASAITAGALGAGITADASLLTTGTVNLSRLSGITSSQMSAAAGIIGGQLAGHTVAEANIVAGTLTDASIAIGAGINGGKLASATVTADRIAPAVPAVNGSNYLLWSEQFDNAVWQDDFRSVTANVALAPDNSFTADLITPTVSGGSTFQALVSDGSTYTFSVWLQAVSGTSTPKVRLYDVNGGTAVDDNTTATTTWYRYSCTQTIPNGHTIRAWIFPSGASGTTPINAWGAQIEKSGTMGAYVRTTGTAQVNQPSTYPFTGGIQESQVLPGTLTDQSIAASANINGSKLLASSVTDTQVASGITASKISGALSAATIAATAVSAGALASGVTINNANWSGTALALTNLGTGALASGVTINNSNWSGTALADANIATGITASKISGALTGATLAATAVTAGALTSTVTINNANWSGTGLAAANIASVNPSALTGTGTVPLAGLAGITTSQLSASAAILGTQLSASANIVGTQLSATANILGSQLSATAGVKGSQLETFMRMGCRYETAYDLNEASGTAITFGNKIYDGQGQMSGAFTGNNLILQSEAFDNASWTNTGTGVSAPTVTANAVVAPDGNTTADQIVIPAVGASQVSTCTQSGSVSAVPYTLSCWLRCPSGNVTIYLMAWTGSTFHSQKCVLTTTWQRFWYATPALTAATWNIGLGINCNDAGQSTTITGPQTFDAWGFQLEQNVVVPGPYVQTTTTTKSTQPSTYGATNYIYSPAASGPVHVDSRVRFTGVSPGQCIFMFLYDNTAAATVSTSKQYTTFTDPLAVAPDGSSISNTDVIDVELRDSVEMTAGHTYTLFFEFASSFHINIISPVGGNWLYSPAWVRGDAFDRTLTYLQPGSYIEFTPIAQ